MLMAASLDLIRPPNRSWSCCLAGSGSREPVGALGGERAARGDDGKPEYVPPGRAPVRPAALAGGAGQRVMLALAVQAGDPVPGDLAVDCGVHLLAVEGGVHLGLPVIW